MKTPQLMEAQAGRAPPLQSAHSLFSGLAKIALSSCRCHGPYQIMSQLHSIYDDTQELTFADLGLKWFAIRLQGFASCNLMDCELRLRKP